MSLEDLRGRKVVLYFYPKDDTPGCTKEACDFRDNLARLAGAGVEVLGVSRDSLESHERFRRKYELPFHLLSDDGSETAKAYGAYGLKIMYGREVEGTIRSTYLIDEDGTIAAAWSPVRVEGHVDEVLAALGAASAPAAEGAGSSDPEAWDESAPEIDAEPDTTIEIDVVERVTTTSFSPDTGATTGRSNGASDAGVRRSRTDTSMKTRGARKPESAAGRPPARAGRASSAPKSAVAKKARPAAARKPSAPAKKRSAAGLGAEPKLAPRASAVKSPSKATRAGSASRAKAPGKAKQSKVAGKAKQSKGAAGRPPASRAKKSRTSASKRAPVAARQPVNKARTRASKIDARSGARKARAAKSARTPVKSLRPAGRSKAKAPARSPAAASRGSRSSGGAKAGRTGRASAPRRLARR